MAVVDSPSPCRDRVAFWSLHRRRRFAGSAIVAWTALFAVFVGSVWLLG